jgi:diaminopimelate decarboxylase
MSKAELSDELNISSPLNYVRQFYEVEDGKLKVGGLNISHFATLLQSDVFYIYSKEVIANKIALFRQKIPSRFSLHYAVKANPLPALLSFISPQVDGFDVASAGEMLKALQAGMKAEKISFAGPAKTDGELKAAIQAGVVLNVESEGELRRICRFAVELTCRPKVALRVNPGFALKSSGMQMSGSAKPFGIDVEQVLVLLPEFSSLPVELQGFHIYCGSQNLQAESLLQAHRATFELLRQLMNVTPVNIKTVNLGGGFGVPYFAGERPLDIARVGEGLAELAVEYESLFQGIELVIELGRYLVAEAGIYACRIQDIKTSGGQTFWCCNGGLHHHLANSGNFGQVIRKNYPVALADSMDCNDRQVVTVVGPLCTPLDILADKVSLSPAQTGDWFVVFQSGAYGASASPQQFLGHPGVSEFLC